MPITIDENANLGVSVLDGGILDITLGGDITSEKHGDELKAWAQKVQDTINQVREKNNGVVYSLVDISMLHKFDEGSVDIVRDLASWSEGTDVKTAVIGGSVLSSMALRTIVYFAKRDNIKSFNTREEALAWFKE